MGCRPWLVVGLHRPWYTSASPSPYPVWQEAFETIFYDYNVDLYITGHKYVPVPLPIPLRKWD
jgi:hypothetical protein